MRPRARRSHRRDAPSWESVVGHSDLHDHAAGCRSDPGCRRRHGRPARAVGQPAAGARLASVPERPGGSRPGHGRPDRHDVRARRAARNPVPRHLHRAHRPRLPVRAPGDALADRDRLGRDRRLLHRGSRSDRPRRDGPCRVAADVRDRRPGCVDGGSTRGCGPALRGVVPAGERPAARRPGGRAETVRPRACTTAWARPSPR